MKGNSRSDPGLMGRMIETLSIKTNELRNRIMIYVLLHRDRSLLMDGMHTMLGGPRHRHITATAHDDVDHRGGGEGESFIVYMNRESATVTEPTPTGVVPRQIFAYTQEDPEDNYRDLTHALLKDSEEEMELTDNEDGNGSYVMNKMRAILEDENVMLDEDEDDDEDDINIDHAADVFIERFRRQMR